jgi:ribosomal-protein-alanine N-acetyltransferase
MKFVFAPMTEKHANDIANWRYDGAYSFYDMAADEDDLRVFTDTANWQDIIRAVLNEDD